MHRSKVPLGFVLVLVTLLLASCSTNLVPPGWSLLAQQEIAFVRERETIPIPAARPAVSKLLLLAKMNDVEVMGLRVLFASGAVHEPDVRDRLQVGRDTLVLDLPGELRRVQEVILKFRKLNNAARRAVIEVWGK